jgi:hypothetical protein
MRLCDDISLVLAFTNTKPHTSEALSLVGRLAYQHNAVIDYGSPLSVFASNVEEDPTWRERVQDAKSSLWGELTMMQALYPHNEATSHIEQLVALRDEAASDMANER